MLRNFSNSKKYLIRHFQYNILFVTSNHQTTNLVFSNFFHEIFSVLGDEKENKFFIGPKLRKNTLFWIKSLFSFSTAQAEKTSWMKQDSWFGGWMLQTRYKSVSERHGTPRILTLFPTQIFRPSYGPSRSTLC